MPALTRSRRLLALISALFLAALLGAAAIPPVAVAQNGPKTRVLVLRGGNAASDSAVIQALQAGGLDVVSGPESTAFAGEPDSLRGVDVVVVLYNANFGTPLLPAGVAALDDYVNKGGSIVAGEWVLWRSQLAPLMPAVHCGWNNAAATTFNRAVPNAAVNEGVPASFALSLTNFSGTESCLQPKEEATVLYTSSNGGGRSNAAGLLAWNVGKGRVAAFSTTLSAAEFESAAFRALFQNTVQWIARTRDTTPPKIKEFAVASAGSLTPVREVQVTLTASDSGGAGLGSYFIREYGYSGNPADGWSVEATSGWLPYEQPRASFTWTLSAKPGVRYLQAFVADRAGNVTAVASTALLNYSPDQASIGEDALHIYRISPPAGTPISVRMEVVSGNPDLYVFGPGVAEGPRSDGPAEQVNFTAQGGVYQIEVEGYLGGNYRLGLIGLPRGGANSDEDNGKDLTRRPRISVTSITPPQPADDASTLPVAPVDETAATSETLYLPLLRR